MRNYLNRNQDRFDNYRQMPSNRASVGKCGHDIKPGDIIGWHRLHGAQCADCWSRWKEENREAAMMEAQSGYEPDYGQY